MTKSVSLRTVPTNKILSEMRRRVKQSQLLKKKRARLLVRLANLERKIKKCGGSA
jgi:vacuolar-type H+-ATPase subunit D/Vma8